MDVEGFAQSRGVANGLKLDGMKGGLEGKGKDNISLSKGGQWLLDQITVMERQYKVSLVFPPSMTRLHPLTRQSVLLAATAVVQHQAYALRL